MNYLIVNELRGRWPRTKEICTVFYGSEKNDLEPSGAALFTAKTVAEAKQWIALDKERNNNPDATIWIRWT